MNESRPYGHRPTHPSNVITREDKFLPRPPKGLSSKISLEDKALVRNQSELIESQVRLIEALTRSNKDKDSLIVALTELIELLKRLANI